MEPLGIIGIVAVGIVYIGLNVYGILTHTGCDNETSEKENFKSKKKR